MTAISVIVQDCRRADAEVDDGADFGIKSFQSQTQSEEFKLELIQLRRLSHLYKFSQLIRYSRACTQYNGFFSGLSLATDGNTTQTKLRSPRLKSAMEKFDWFYL